MFSWKGRGMKGESQATHTRSGLLAHYTHTPSMYTNINTAMYTFTWDLCPAQAPGSGWGGLQGAGTGRQEPGGGRGPAPLLSQHPQSISSLRSGAGRAGAKHLWRLESQASPLTLPSGSPPRLFPGPWVSARVSRLPQGLEGGGCPRPASVLAPPASSRGSQEAGAAARLGGGAGNAGRLSAGGGGRATALAGAAVLDEDVGTLLAAGAPRVGQRGQAAGVPAPHVHPVLQKEARSQGWQERCGVPPRGVAGGGRMSGRSGGPPPPDSPR